MHKPADLSHQEAASLLLLLSTAYTSLDEIAKHWHAQWVLIHAAEKPIGQAAVKIAWKIGAKVSATVGSPEQRDTIIEKHSIPAERVFDSYNLSSFGPVILTAAQGHGLVIVLNSLDGPLLQQTFNLVVLLGNFVEIGKRRCEDEQQPRDVPVRPPHL